MSLGSQTLLLQTTMHDPKGKFLILGFKDPFLAARLIALGIYPGKELEIKRKALLGGAFYVEVDCCHFALREDELLGLELKQIPDVRAIV